MVSSIRFRLQQVGGTLDTVSCPDPESAEWEWTEPTQISLTGRSVQQGRLRVTLHWELMSDDDFGDLMDEWKQSRDYGYRIESVAVPTFTGHDNAVWPTFFGAGSPGNYIRFMMPRGRRTVLHVEDVVVVFEDIMENS